MMASTEDLLAIKATVEARYLAQPGVTGIDVGYKFVGGVKTDEVAIRIHVASKRRSVPKAQLVPAEIDGAVTDVLERTYELQVAQRDVGVGLLADTVHYTTLEGGISIGPSRVVGGSIFAGTLGAIVIDNVTNQRAALTNFHVACVDSTWAVGDRQVQPSRIDTGSVPADEFGAILRATLSAEVDGSVLSIDSGRTSSGDVVDIGNVRGTTPATLGAVVRKRGRTTGLTHGSVDGLGASVNIDYGDGIGVRTLTNQISIATDTTQNPLFSDHGDSGSVVIDANGFVIGLLFAGGGTNTLANPIASVLSELNVSMLTGKSIVKDIKDGRKDFIKDKELRKELAKDKELRKELIKDKELRKELLPDNKGFKDIIDTPNKRIGDNIPIPTPGDPPFNPGGGLPGGGLPSGGLPGAGGQSDTNDRLSALEATLSALTSFIAADLRPDLSQSAFSGEQDLGAADVAQLRAEIEQQIADSVAAKAELDTPSG